MGLGAGSEVHWTGNWKLPQEGKCREKRKLTKLEEGKRKDGEGRETQSRNSDASREAYSLTE